MTDTLRDDDMWSSLSCWDKNEIKYSSKDLFPMISDLWSRPQLFSAFFKLNEILIILMLYSWLCFWAENLPNRYVFVRKSRGSLTFKDTGRSVFFS